jgi:peptidoglycan-N-acetylglucosamine deacetylase
MALLPLFDFWEGPMPWTKNAYLTIDDAPTKDFGWKTDYLKSLGIPAVFYCTGKSLEENFNPALDGLKKGFILGNHSYSHRHFSELTLEEARDEIMKTHRILEELYKQAGLPMVRTFRFPYGDNGGGEEAHMSGIPADKARHAGAIQDFLKENGYAQPVFRGITYPEYLKNGLLDKADVFWTFDCREWTVWTDNASFEDLEKRIDKDDVSAWFGLNQPGSSEIVLLHDHEGSSHVFKPLIDKLLSKNLKFILPDFAR